MPEFTVGLVVSQGFINESDYGGRDERFFFWSLWYGFV